MYFYFTQDSAECAVYGTPVSCHIKCKMQLIPLAGMRKHENIQNFDGENHL